MKKTKQEIFDTVLNHLRNQKVASIVSSYRDAYPDNLCKYRGPNNTSCAVGCMIPDDLYKAKYEGKFSGDLPKTLLKKMGIFEESDIVGQLQEAHDKYLRLHGLPIWEQEMQNIAEKYELKYDKVA